MPLYEHVFLARQDISQQQVEALQKEFTDILAEGGGKVSKTEYWGLRSLPYKVKKNRKAHYALFNVDAPPAAVAEMERRMGLNTDVLRFITIRVEAHETEPSIQMRKGDRDDRRDGDRGGFRGGERGGDRGGRPPRGDGGGFRGGDRGDRPPRADGGGFRGDRPDRPPREGGFRSDRGPRPPREGGLPPRDAAPTPKTEG